MPIDKDSFGAGIVGGAINGAIGQGMGLVFGGIQDRRQREQAKKLGEIQGQQNRQQADYQQKLSMDMMDKYGTADAKRKQLEDAGLSVGLMYGGGGGGGATAPAGAAVGGVSGQSSDGGAARTGMGIQIAGQMALMNAQKENIEADTANKKAGAGKTTIETTGAGIDNEIKRETKGDVVSRVKTEADKAVNENRKLFNEGIISEKTQQTVIKRMESEAVGVDLDNALIRNNINLTRAKINQIEEGIKQAWREIALKGRQVTVQEIQAAWQETMARKGMNLQEMGLDQKIQMDAINSVLKGAAIIGGKTIIE